MLLADFIRQANERLSPFYGKGEASSLTALLCKGILGVERHAHILNPSTEVPEDRFSLLEDALVRLEGNEPVQYILGSADFFGHSFNVNPSVLIPRQETELLCSLAGDFLKGCNSLQGMGRPRVLDLCTGSGCIAWSVAALSPSAQVTGVDLSAAALGTASSQPLTIPNPPVFMLGNVLDTDSMAALGNFELILANPPYVRESEKMVMDANVLQHEPHLALFVDDDDPLVFYRAIAQIAQRQLVPGGRCIVEINEALSDETVAVFESALLSKTRKMRDLNDKFRFVIAEK